MSKLLSRSSNLVLRNYAASKTIVPCRRQAECWPKPEYGPMEVHRSNFLNGMKLAAASPLGAPICACTIMFQVGSRHEIDDELGVTHFLRAGSIMSGAAYSRYIKTRVLHQCGGFLSCSSDRQTVSYTLRCPMPVFPELKCYLLDCGVRCLFPHYELDDIKRMVREDLDRRTSESHVMDLIQKACFAGPLSNSVYCAEGRIDSMTSETIQNFVETLFRTNICSVGSFGVPFEEALKVASHIDCGRTERPPYMCMSVSCPRGGYEFFDKGRGEMTYVALGVPGAGTCDTDCFLKHAILAATLGQPGSSPQPWLHIADQTPAPPMTTLAEGDPFVNIKAFNISYMDTGVWGFLIQSDAKKIRCLTLKVNEFFANLCQKISIRDIDIGKKRLKLGAMAYTDTCERMAENLALQNATCCPCDGPRHLARMIDAIPPEEIIQTAGVLSTKHCSGQLAVAVVGDVAAAPDDSEMCIF
ncbi:cytochrome b-c1 complex subunit 2, mitochondrial-like [Pectinophora gossypiella]|uniref:cytochrome b-c1 complex subunit 2, mitochondrial-like n=1 Tax=Pectinophora gossypiella TaxID=13191 RepID=UPI00214EFA9D|nr:cytochrome b-c1 complex subunit 2, mitochondrial-like [Pectinophora gossypiella]